MQPISGRNDRAGRAAGFVALTAAVLLAAPLGSAQERPGASDPDDAITGAFRVPASGSGTNRPSTFGSLLGMTPEQEQMALGGIAEKIKELNTFTSRGLENPLVRARFEKYLNAPEADAAAMEEYRALYRRVLDALMRREIGPALTALFLMADYEWDARISETLAVRVLTARDMRLTQAQLDAKIRRLKQEIDTATWNTDMIMSQESLSRPPGGGATGGRSGSRGGRSGGTNAPPEAATAEAISALIGDGVRLVPGKMRAMSEYVKMLEARASLKANELRSEVIEARNRADLEDYISTLFTSRRHLHVIMGAEFYRALYGDGNYPPTLANQVNASKELIRDVDEAVTVFKYKMDHEELAGAWEHLQYAFAASEFHPAVLTLSRDLKRQVRSFGVNVVKLQNKIEARDFGGVEPLLQEMETQASDFDATKARSIVEAVKLHSTLRLGAARLAAQQGDLQTAMNEFRAAAETWPGNPDLDIAQLGFFSSQDLKTRLQEEFDRLVDTRNYRAIFERQLQLATALVGDIDRAELMKAALEKVRAVETAIEKANMFRRNNNLFGAWEALERAAREWPDDSVLNKMRAELSAESAEFVHQLKKGEEAERMGDYGYSLACYLNAQRLYPASELARDAVDRVSAKILRRNNS